MQEVSGNERFKVVVNDEGHFSIWSSLRPPPPGWNETGFEGSKTECLDHIRLVWVDMRPLSVRSSREQV
jgi:MbtH protein